MSLAGKTGGSYSPPARKSTTVRGSYMRTESAGIETGLSSRADLDAESQGMVIGYDVGIGGDAKEQMVKNPKGGSATEKGNKFTFC